MNKMNGIDQTIEDFGMFLERFSFPPVAARVYALLILAEPHEFHFDEVQDRLGISKGATSEALNFLATSQRVLVRTRPGVRKRFYGVGRLPGTENLGAFKHYVDGMGRFLRIALDLSADGEYAEKVRGSLVFTDKLIAMIDRLEEEFS